LRTLKVFWYAGPKETKVLEIIAMKRNLLLLLCCAFGCFIAAFPCVAQTAVTDGAPRHIVMVLVDALRADHLGCYGYARNTSPFLDQLAAESVLFERAYSQSSFTVESTISLFTSLYPSSNAWGGGQYANTNPEVPDLATLLGSGGYHTAYFSTNPTLDYTALHKSFQEHEFLAKTFDKKSRSPELTARALRFITERKDEKTFMYLHYVSPHTPYTPPDDYYLRFAPEVFPKPLDAIDDVRAHLDTLLEEGFGPGEARFEDLMLRYDAEIALEDDAIRNLFEGMRQLGITEDTLFIFLADHGEEFLEHGFVEHAWSLFPESIHVPLFFWMPKRLAPGRVATPVALVDVLPSILDLAGLPSAPHTVDGVPLFHLENGHWLPRPKEKALISELLNPARNVVRSVVEGDYLYVAATKWLSLKECVEVAQNMSAVRAETLTGTRPSPDPWGPLHYEALFNLKTDPTAKDNVLEQLPEIRDRMRKILGDMKARAPEQVPDPVKICRIPFVITYEMRKFLVEQGYLKPEDMTGPDAAETEELIRGLGYF